MQLLGGDLFGLKLQVRSRPWARHDNGRTHSTKLGGEPFVVLGLVRLTIIFAFGTYAPDNRIVRRTRTSDVQFFNDRVCCQIRTRSTVTLDNAQGVQIDQRLERNL